MTKIKDIKTTIYKWTGEIVPPAQNFCTNPTDILRESGDKMKSFRFHQWMVCERKGGRWIPVTFHITLESTFKSVRERKLRESGVSSAQEFLLALSRENQKLVDAITERSKNADSE